MKYLVYLLPVLLICFVTCQKNDTTSPAGQFAFSGNQADVAYGQPILYTRNNTITEAAQINDFIKRNEIAAGWFDNSGISGVDTLRFYGNNQANLVSAHDTCNVQVQDSVYLLLTKDSGSVASPINNGGIDCNDIVTHTISFARPASCITIASATGYTNICKGPSLYLFVKKGDAFYMPFYTLYHKQTVQMPGNVNPPLFTVCSLTQRMFNIYRENAADALKDNDTLLVQQGRISYKAF